MKKKIIERYRERIRNRESVCITLNLIPKMIKNNDNWRVYYEGWTDKELRLLYDLLYKTAGHRWKEREVF